MVAGSKHRDAAVDQLHSPAGSCGRAVRGGAVRSSHCGQRSCLCFRQSTAAVVSCVTPA